MAVKTRWQAVRDKKLAEQHAILEPYLLSTSSLPSPVVAGSERIRYVNECAALTDREVEITSWPASNLLQSLREGTATCVEVTTAFIQRVTIAHQLTNCLTEPLFSSALSRAAELDALPPSSRRPLHGLPISLKDQFNVAGVDTTLGYISRCHAPAPKSEQSVLVSILQDAGAIPIVKTNLPQSILWCETQNPIFGITTHPLNPAYTPGGSTGGEAALLAHSASHLGWGTDIGGSIRIPAALCGLWGLKPSSTRIPYSGVPVSQEGQPAIPSVVGPLTREMGMLEVGMRAVLGGKPWERDPGVAPMPWRYEEVKAAYVGKKVRIGVMGTDHIVTPLPPVQRVFEELVQKLKGMPEKYELVEWPALGHRECLTLMDRMYTVDGGEEIRRSVTKGGEPFLPHVERLISRGKAVSVLEYWEMNTEKIKLQKAYLELWTSAGLDFVLCPVMPHPAVPHERTKWVGYTKIWNFLDLPAAVFPVDKVTHEDMWKEYVAREGTEMEEMLKATWEEFGKGMVGMPVGLQLVGRRLREEEVLVGLERVVEDCKLGTEPMVS
ncbi:amidase [Saitoella complicata NRRL Y-17804]|nr:amidase [Saitoella complicata NRRL Y-17804]ODQ52279.1 amidase [Saitoella complicata NRRL Y-17804]